MATGLLSHGETETNGRQRQRDRKKEKKTKRGGMGRRNGEKELAYSYNTCSYQMRRGGGREVRRGGGRGILLSPVQ